MPSSGGPSSLQTCSGCFNYCNTEPAVSQLMTPIRSCEFLVRQFKMMDFCGTMLKTLRIKNANKPFDEVVYLFLAKVIRWFFNDTF